MSAQPPADETARLLARTFALDSAPPPDLDAFRVMLAVRIGEMLDRERHLLWSLLYRIDVDERRLRNVLDHSPPDRLAADLADLVIERQLRKIETRLRWKERDSSP